MKITKRERSLLAITIAAIVLGVNYVLILPLGRSWGDTGRKLAIQQRELTAMKAVIERQPQWQKEYDELKRNLGQRSERFQRPSDVVKKVQEVASTSGVVINSRREMPPEDKGIYRVLPVQCTLEATTEPLVKFLFALQTGAGFVSVEQLRVSPKPENATILRCDIQVRALAGKSEGSALVNLEFAFTALLAAVSAAVDTGAAARAVAAVSPTVSTGATARVVDTHSFSRYQIIVDRSPFGAVSVAGADNAPQPNFAARFNFFGTAQLSETQSLMAIIQDKEANNRIYFKSAGDTIGAVTVARVEKSPSAKVVLKQGLETATLTLATKLGPGTPSPSSAATGQPQRGQAPAPSPTPGVRRVPFQRGG